MSDEIPSDGVYDEAYFQAMEIFNAEDAQYVPTIMSPPVRRRGLKPGISKEYSLSEIIKALSNQLRTFASLLWAEEHREE
jgi:hypothetical protein